MTLKLSWQQRALAVLGLWARALLTSEDIYIKPDLDGITAADFNKFRDGAERGRAAAQAQAEKLRHLAVPEAQYIAWQEKRHLPPPPSPRPRPLDTSGPASR